MNTHSPIAWEQVDEIRNLYTSRNMTLGALAVKYSINKGTVCRIVNFKTWKPENDPRRKTQNEAHNG